MRRGSKTSSLLGYTATLLIVWFSGSAYAHGIEATNLERRSGTQSMSWIERLIGAKAAAKVSVDSRSGHRFIKGDGWPGHATGAFPNRGNPHTIQPQNFEYRMPLSPQRAPKVSLVGHNDFGIAVNGIPFDGATAEFWNRDRRSIWNYEAKGGSVDLGLDQNNAHVQPDGSYHYHGVPVGLVEKMNYRARPAMIGYAADGFPIYAPFGYRDPRDAKSGIKELKPSFRLRQGVRPSGPGGRYDGRFGRDFEYVEGLGDLDECNGRTGVTPEYPKGTYYYVLTIGFPFIPRCWIGTPDSSFQKYPGKRRGIDPTAAGRPQEHGPRNSPQGGRRGPPREAVQACVGRSLGDGCSFRAPVGHAQGICRAVRSGEKACVPKWNQRGRLGTRPGSGIGGRTRPPRGLGPLRP